MNQPTITSSRNKETNDDKPNFQNNSKRKEKFSRFERLISFFSAVISIFLFVQGIILYRYKNVLAEQENRLELLMLDASIFASGFKITSPDSDITVYKNTYDKLEGSFHGRIPYGRKIFVLIKDGLGYRLPDKEPTVNHFKRSWNQTGLSFGVEGLYEIIICLADNESAKQMDTLRYNKDAPKRFSVLPSGIFTLGTVKITYSKGG